MGEIKRFDFEMHNYGGCDMCYAEMEEAEDGEYIEYEDHLKAIAAAKREGFKRFIDELCRQRSICSNALGCIACELKGKCVANGRCNPEDLPIEEIIKKAEGL